jgi:hypothetical protein
MQTGGQLTQTTIVENFPGYPDGVDANQMMMEFREQAERFGCDIRDGEVTAVDFSKKPYVVTIDGDKQLEADTVIIATGAITKAYAEKWLAPLSNIVLQDPFWKNQVVQYHVLNDGSIEMMPRVGGHVIYLGQPTNVEKKLSRMQKFYRYGLMQAGWNKYSRVSVEFDNQIICKRK